MERNVQEQTNQEMVYMLWSECIPNNFYKHICKNENFIYLNGENISYVKSSKII